MFDIFICKFCAAEKKSKKSLVGHETFCKENPNRKIQTDNTGKKRTKKPIVLETNILEFCSYGCGNIAKYKNISGSYMCATNPSICPENKKKNSLGGKKAYSSGKRKDQKTLYKSLPEETKRNMAWAKGLTKETDERIKRNAEKSRGKRKITDKEKVEYLNYRDSCKFNFDKNEISKIKGYKLLNEFGMYNKSRNIDGVVRDHRISIFYGWKNKIDPFVISHPANCEFIFHKENASKSIKNSVELSKLIEEIKIWDLSL